MSANTLFVYCYIWLENTYLIWTIREKSLQDSIDVAIVAVLISHKYETVKTQMYLNKYMDMHKIMYTYIYVLAKLNTYPPIYYFHRYLHTYTHDKQK